MLTAKVPLQAHACEGLFVCVLLISLVHSHLHSDVGRVLLLHLVP